MIRIHFIFILICFNFYLFAQKEKIVKGVKGQGRWEVVGDVSPMQAEEKALLEAKKDVLLKAGANREVKSFNLSSIINGEDKLNDEKFMQLNSIMLDGLVRIKKPIQVSKE